MVTTAAPRAPAALPQQGPVNPAAISAFLDRDQPAIRRAVRDLLLTAPFAAVGELDSEAQRARVLEQARVVARHGFGALAFPKAHGGAENTGGFFAAFETLALYDYSLCIKFGVQFGLFAGSIYRLGTERHYAQYLAPASTLALPGCFAMSELGHGSNVKDIETIARYDATTDTFDIHTPHGAAHKEWIGNAARHGQMATVFAQLYVGDECHGVHAYLVPIRDAQGQVMPGVRIEDTGRKMGLNGVDNGRLWFEHVRIPRASQLDRFGGVADDGTYASPIASPARRFFVMLSTLVGGRVTVAGASVSAAKVGLTVAVRYAADRRQFGPAGGRELPLLDFLSHQRRLLPALAHTYAHDFALKALGRRFLADTNGEDREVETIAAGLKAIATWQNLETLQQCRECCGGQGFLMSNRIAGMRADTDVAVTFEGDNTVLMQLVAKARLAEYKTRLGGDGVGRVVRYLSERAAHHLAGLDPIHSRQHDQSHLRDPEWQAKMFAYREERITASAARRMAARLERGTDPFLAAVECQDHLLALGEASIDRVIFEAFRDGLSGEASPEVRAMLEPLAQLHALSRLEHHLGWFLETGVIEGVKSRAIRAQVNALCAEIRPNAVAYVDGFGIPDGLLAAPIAFSALPTA